MSQIQATRSGNSNTVHATDRAKSNVHEDIKNMFKNEDLKETPLVSSIDQVAAKGLLHDWLVDNYADPKAQTIVEGADYDASKVNQTPRRRITNVPQIFREELGVSGTVQALNIIGTDNELALQMKKKIIEVRRNVEFQYTRTAKGTTGTNPSASEAKTVVQQLTDPRQSGGLQAYADIHVDAADLDGSELKQYTASGGAGSNYVLGTYQANGTTYVGANASAPVSLTYDMINSVITEMYLAGGRPDSVFMHPTLKSKFTSVFVGGGGNTTAHAARNIDALETKLNVAITSVMTEFGFELMLIPNYVMAFNNSANEVFFVDTNNVKDAVLPARDIQKKILDDNGDGKRALILTERCMEAELTQSIAVLHNVKA